MTLSALEERALRWGKQLSALLPLIGIWCWTKVSDAGPYPRGADLAGPRVWPSYLHLECLNLPCNSSMQPKLRWQAQGEHLLGPSIAMYPSKFKTLKWTAAQYSGGSETTFKLLKMNFSRDGSRTSLLLYPWLRDFLASSTQAVPMTGGNLLPLKAVWNCILRICERYSLYNYKLHLSKAVLRVCVCLGHFILFWEGTVLVTRKCFRINLGN